MLSFFGLNFVYLRTSKQGRRLVVVLGKGSYYLDLMSKSSYELHQALKIGGSEKKKRKSEIWLWHRRLGHASFG